MVLRKRRHFKNVFEEGELQQEATIAFFATVQMDGKWRKDEMKNHRVGSGNHFEIIESPDLWSLS